MKLSRNLVPDESLIEFHGTYNRYGLVVGADADESRGSGRGDITIGGVHSLQPVIFIQAIVPLAERFVLPVGPRRFAAEKIVNRSFVCGILVHQDNRVKEYREVRPCRGVNVHSLGSAGEMSSSRESHHTDLLYSPVL